MIGLPRGDLRRASYILGLFLIVIVSLTSISAQGTARLSVLLPTPPSVNPQLENDFATCEGPMIDVFPLTPAKPKLPEPSKKEYIPGQYVCRHFAFDFCKAFKLTNPFTKCYAMFFADHAINTFDFVDSNGKKWVCFVEPQPVKDTQGKPYTDYYCIEPEKIAQEGGFVKYVQQIICKKYYQLPDDLCNLSVDVVQLCEQQVGSACSISQWGQTQSCYNSPGISSPILSKLECTCNVDHQCKWVPSTCDDDHCN